MSNSICSMPFEDCAASAFARVLSNHSTCAYLCDVFVIPPHRAPGIGTALMSRVLEHLSAKGLGRVVLVTLDGHGLTSGSASARFRNVEVDGDRAMPCEAYEQELLQHGHNLRVAIKSDLADPREKWSHDD